MTIEAVNWYEGMFLVPHQFQAAQRFSADQMRRHIQWGLNHHWGLRTIDIDQEALKNFRFVVRSLDARFRDGTMVSVPRDLALGEIDLRGFLENTSNVTIALALPIVQLTRANLQLSDSDEARYAVVLRDVEDENTGKDQQPLQLRRLNITLKVDPQPEAGGYEYLTIAKVSKSVIGLPELEPGYIPPVLACEAWKALRLDILDALYNRIGGNLKSLSDMLLAQRIGFDSKNQGDIQFLELTRILNEGYSTLFYLIGENYGIHPFQAYLELVRLVGKLAIFDDERILPELPIYDHDNLGYTLYTLKKLLDKLLQGRGEPTYKMRAFIGTGLRMQVAMEPSWLEPTYAMFIGVTAPDITSDECILMLTKQGSLDMKIGSSDRADQIFREGGAGLKFKPTNNPPTMLPRREGLTYFQISRDTQPHEWQAVQRTLQLAVRLNERLIQGDIAGREDITVTTLRGKTAKFKFTLYVLSETMTARPR
jgi:type VI secretion system protein ImpJ